MKENNEDIIKDIKKKIKNNPKYIHPCNKEFQEDIKKYGFENGNGYIGWMRLNRILNNNACKEYRDKWARDKGFKNDIDLRKHKKDKLIDIYPDDTRKSNLELIEEPFVKIRTHLPPNQKCYRCDIGAYRRERDNKGNWTGKYVCKKHYEEDYYSYNRNPESKRYVKILEDEKCYRCYKIAERGQIDSHGNWTGKYVCMNCYWNDWYHNHRDKILREKSRWRKGELDPEGTKYRSYIYEQVICITLGVKNLNIENDNWNSLTDGDKHEKYGYLSIKGAVLEYCDEWSFADTDKGKFNTLMLVCMDKYNEHVDRIYAVPEEEARKRTGIKIRIGSTSWIDKYRIDEKSF